MEDFPLKQELCDFIKARETARILGHSGDPIVDTYRFCNVKREHDRVTEWLAANWYRNDDNIVPAMVMARLFNNPDTLALLGYPHTWMPESTLAMLRMMQTRGDKIFNAAYIVSTNGRRMDKCEYVINEVLTPIFNFGGTRLQWPELEDVWRYLMDFNGIGSFIGAQVVADLKNIEGSIWQKAPDWVTFCAPGPGSQRGLNRLRGLQAKAQHYNQKAFKLYINQVRRIIGVGTGISLCNQNTQNCLCEFDKYMRARTGEGRPKQLYKRRV